MRQLTITVRYNGVLLHSIKILQLGETNILTVEKNAIISIIEVMTICKAYNLSGERLKT